MPNLEEIKKQISDTGGASKFLTRKEVKQLPGIIHDNETILSIVQGRYNSNYGILIATTSRVLFIDKKLIGIRVEEFSYDKISSVQYETGILRGKLKIFSSGNKATIDSIMPKDRVKTFTDIVREHIASGSSQEKSEPIDNYAQIEKLASLKEKGIITKAEFDIEKKKLLGQ